MGGASSLWRAFWRDLPLLNFAAYALAFAYAEVVALDPPWPELFFTAGFPLAVPLVVYAVRWPRATAAEKAAGVVVVLGTFALLVLVFLFVRPRPVEIVRLRLLFEWLMIGNGAVLLVHAWTTGPSVFRLVVGPLALYGALLENGGILLGFFSELHYTLYLPLLPAPLTTMIGWVVVLYLSLWTAWEVRRIVPGLRRTALGSAAVATLAALLVDLQMDPLATALDFWSWNPRLVRGPLGVPVVNFVAWACAVLPFAFLLFLRQKRRDLAPHELGLAPHLGGLLLRVPLVLAAAAALFLATMVAIEGGFDGPTFAILREALSGGGLLPAARLPVPMGR